MASSKSKRRIHDLPDEVLEIVFGKLSFWPQCEAKLVCKRWRAKLSSITTRTKEGWIIVSCADRLLYYSINQNRWLRTKPIRALGLPLSKHAEFSCAIGELIIFHDNKSRLLASWNVVTGESKLLKAGLFSGGREKRFGAHFDEKTNELNLLLCYCVETWGDYCKMLACSTESEGRWEACDLPRAGCGLALASFQNLSNSLSRVVPVLASGDGGHVMHLFDVDKRSISQSLRLPTGKLLDIDHCGFHFPNGDTYVIWPGRFDDQTYRFEVMRFHVVRQEWELVAQPTEEMISSMTEEAGTHRILLYCSDGVENIWAVLPGWSRMLRYNVVSGSWITLPSIVPKRRYIPLCGAVYTSF